MNKIKKLFFLFILSSILFCSLEVLENTKLVELSISSFNHPVYVLKIPKGDKKRLEYLFQNFFLNDHGLYTLVGKKPMSLGVYLKPLGSWEFWHIYDSFSLHNLKMYSSWQTWKKYQHLFKNPKFAFWSEKSPWIHGVDVILLLNKPEAEAIVKNYVQDFHQILQRQDIKVKSLPDGIKNRPFLIEQLKKHEGLIGTLLGYGRENAWLYHRRSKGENIQLSMFWDKEECKQFKKLYPCYKVFKKRSIEISSDLFLPNFVVDKNSEETQELKKSYRQMREKIIETYKERDFLETTLSLLY